MKLNQEEVKKAKKELPGFTFEFRGKTYNTEYSPELKEIFMKGSKRDKKELIMAIANAAMKRKEKIGHPI